jgi:cytochrome c oxidase subunit IV
MVDGVGSREEFIAVRARLYGFLKVHVSLSDCIGDSHVKCFLDWSLIICTKVCPTGLV